MKPQAALVRTDEIGSLNAPCTIDLDLTVVVLDASSPLGEGDRRLLEPGTERFREYYRENPEKIAPDEEFRSAEAPARCISGEGAAAHEVVWARAY